MSNQSLTPPFGPQDVEVLERETPFQGFFRVDTLTLRHKHYNGGWGEPVRRELFVRPPAAAVLPYDPVRGEILLVEPDVAVYEFANVMRYMDELTTEQVQLAVNSLLALPIRWLKPDAGLMQRTVAIAREHDATVYDAVFAAMAEQLSAPYVTADMRFVRRVPDLAYVRPLAGFRLS